MMTQLWRPTDHSATVGLVDVPIHLIGGWYDFFLDGQLADYAALVATDRSPHLTIGPWPHAPSTLELYRFGHGAALDWFHAAITGDRSQIRDKPVRVKLMGTGEWLDLDTWPPPAREHQLHLVGPDRLSTAPSAAAPPSAYRYDPADPTPAAGGALLYDGGPVDNRERDSPPIRTRRSTTCT